MCWIYDIICLIVATKTETTGYVAFVQVPNGAKIGYVTSVITVIILVLGIIFDIISNRERSIRTLKRNLIPAFRRWKAHQWKPKCLCCRTFITDINAPLKVGSSNDTLNCYVNDRYRQSTPVTFIKPDKCSQAVLSHGSERVDLIDMELEKLPEEPPKPVNKLERSFFAQRANVPLYEP